MGSCSIQRPACERCAVRVARGAVIANVLLGIFKLITGAIANSMAVMVDGVQSLACAAVGGFVAAGMRMARRPCDRRYPYGYGKVEYLVSIASYAALFGLALFILASSIYLLVIGRSEPPRFIALPVAIVSIVGNYLLWRACNCAGRATNSAGLLANATQNRADMLSSIAVAASVSCSLLGPSWYFCDALGAALAALMILVEAATSWWSDMQVLLERSIPKGLCQQVDRIVSAVDGVVGRRFIRGRRLGKGVAMQVGIIVPESATVSEAQRVATATRVKVMCDLPTVSDVAVYPYTLPEG